MLVPLDYGCTCTGLDLEKFHLIGDEKLKKLTGQLTECRENLMLKELLP